MRKILLSGLAALALSASATNPQVYEDWQIVSLSPNGEWAISVLYGRLWLLNTNTGEYTSFVPDEDDWETSYEEGTGNCVSNSGRFVGSTNGNNAMWCDGGEWHALQVPKPEVTNGSNGITPDNLRICGSIGTMQITLEDTDVPMNVPGYWDLLPDGTYSDVRELPYPALDWTGRVPQYVTASIISDDGRVIAGQVRDYSGTVSLPIIFSQDDEGNWSYKVYGEDLVNPNHVKLPPYPGEAPMSPEMKDFMTEEELAAYNAALEEWNASGEYNWETYPNMEDYLSEAGKEAYDAAMEKYNLEFSEWSNQYNAFSAVFEQIMSEGMQFEFNMVFLSPDGKKVAAGGKKEVADENSWRGFTIYYCPVLFDVATGESKVYDYEQNIALSAISGDYTLLGSCLNSQTYGYEARIALPGDNAFTPLQDYIASKSPELGNWMKENMFHDLETFDPETFDPIVIEGAEYTGIPRCNSDMSRIACTVTNVFDYDSDAMTWAYLFELPVSAVRNVTEAEFGLRALRGGDILLTGKATRLVISDLNGRVVYDAAPASDRIATGLPAGIYVVKATAADGQTKVTKAIF